MTIVHNEPVFLSIWLRYYSRFFAPSDIYVLDHDTTDGSTAGGGFVRIPVSHDSVDHVWMVETVQALQHELLERYDVVLVTDVDEMIAPDPRKATLGEYIAAFDADFVNCQGYELVHVRETEPPYDPSRPILDQRGFWWDNDYYSKPLLARVPMNWIPGFHSRTDRQTNPDPDLYLIHLHRLDYDICKQRHRERRKQQWNQLDLDEGWAMHNRFVDDELFSRWFYTSMFEPGNPVFPRAPIPPYWRGLF